MSDVTRILNSIDSGDERASEKLLPLVYDELRRLAAQKMTKERPGQTLQATALVHEAWLRLLGDEDPQWQNSRHFLSAAAESMRRILVENARRKARLKHGGDLSRVRLDDIQIPAETNGQRLTEVHEALDQLEIEDEAAAEVVKLHFFAGLTFEEIGRALEISERTARRRWKFAKVRLFQEIQRQKEDSIADRFEE